MFLEVSAFANSAIWETALTPKTSALRQESRRLKRDEGLSAAFPLFYAHLVVF